MIKRKYDRYNGRCYIIVECDFCGFSPASTLDGHGITSKKCFSEFEKIGWEKRKDGKIICASCADTVKTTE